MTEQTGRMAVERMGHVLAVALVSLTTACFGTPAEVPAANESITQTVYVETEGRSFAMDLRGTAGHRVKAVTVLAGRDLLMVFRNRDEGVRHSTNLYRGSSGSAPVFVGEPVKGPGTVTYHVPPLEEGTYVLRCAVRPSTIRATLLVR